MHLENEKILFMLFCTELETAPDVNHLSWMTLSGYKKKIRTDFEPTGLHKVVGSRFHGHEFSGQISNDPAGFR
jgi:hypothetical protein